MILGTVWIIAVFTRKEGEKKRNPSDERYQTNARILALSQVLTSCRMVNYSFLKTQLAT